jgi:hypothetical protein
MIMAALAVVMIMDISLRCAHPVQDAGTGALQHLDNDWPVAAATGLQIPRSLG